MSTCRDPAAAAVRRRHPVTGAAHVAANLEGLAWVRRSIDAPAVAIQVRTRLHVRETEQGARAVEREHAPPPGRAPVAASTPSSCRCATRASSSTSVQLDPLELSGPGPQAGRPGCTTWRAPRARRTGGEVPVVRDGQPDRGHVASRRPPMLDQEGTSPWSSRSGRTSPRPGLPERWADISADPGGPSRRAGRGRRGCGRREGHQRPGCPTSSRLEAPADLDAQHFGRCPARRTPGPHRTTSRTRAARSGPWSGQRPGAGRRRDAKWGMTKRCAAAWRCPAGSGGRPAGRTPRPLVATRAAGLPSARCRRRGRARWPWVRWPARRGSGAAPRRARAGPSTGCARPTACSRVDGQDRAVSACAPTPVASCAGTTPNAAGTARARSRFGQTARSREGPATRPLRPR